MVRGPGVPAGRTIHQLVGNADLAPTFADWAGVAVPADVDGRSFAPLLAAADPTRVRWRWALPLASLPESRKQLATSWPDIIDPSRRGGYRCIATSGTSMPEMRGVRTRSFTFTHYASGDMELYDTAANPDQLNNRICTAASTTHDRLRRLAEALSTCRGAACRALENSYVP